MQIQFGILIFPNNFAEIYYSLNIASQKED
jgi:hypothetical protein